MREQLGVMPEAAGHIERIVVAPEFQLDLSRVWQQYLAIGNALAADDALQVPQFVSALESAVEAVNAKSLADHAAHVWSREQANLTKLVDSLKKADNIQAIRTQFLPLSQEIGVLAKTFGFGEGNPIFELHCPMAFQNKGGVWYQDNKQVRNPYFGATMLKCADRVEQLRVEEG
jgi:Cu(I)/Ag(I) efflux system membrane fusion protein